MQGSRDVGIGVGTMNAMGNAALDLVSLGSSEV
jgi:hypothetical protein